MLLACCDKSTIVALEAIKGLAGASFPTATSIAAADGSNSSSGGSSSRRPPVLPDEHVEADVRVKCSMGWQLLLAHAGDEAPEYRESAAAAGAAAPAMVKQSTMARYVNVEMEVVGVSVRAVAFFRVLEAFLPGTLFAISLECRTSDAATASRSGAAKPICTTFHMHVLMDLRLCNVYVAGCSRRHSRLLAFGT